MSLHGLLSVTIGVPNVGQTAAYYADFGLAPAEDNWFATADAGRQLRIEYAPTRRLVEMRVAAALLPAPRRPRRHDDRGPRATVKAWWYRYCER